MTEHPANLHRAVEAAKVLRLEIVRLVRAEQVDSGEPWINERPVHNE